MRGDASDEGERTSVTLFQNGMEIKCERKSDTGSKNTVLCYADLNMCFRYISYKRVIFV